MPAAGDVVLAPLPVPEPLDELPELPERDDEDVLLPELPVPVLAGLVVVVVTVSVWV